MRNFIYHFKFLYMHFYICFSVEIVGKSLIELHGKANSQDAGELVVINTTFLYHIIWNITRIHNVLPL